MSVEGGIQKQRTASAYNAYFSILKTFCGLGLLSVPFGFRQGGIALGMCLAFVVCVISNWGARLIINVKMDVENTSAVSCITLQARAAAAAAAAAAALLIIPTTPTIIPTPLHLSHPLHRRKSVVSPSAPSLPSCANFACWQVSWAP